MLKVHQRGCVEKSEMVLGRFVVKKASHKAVDIS